MEELESAILALPRAERARLAERLLTSLDDEPEVEAAWADEVRQRLAEYRAGEADPISSDDVMKDAEQRLRP